MSGDGPAGRSDAAEYEFIEAGPPFLPVLDKDGVHSGLLESASFDGAAYLAEYRRRCLMSVPVGAYRFRDVDVTGPWMLVSRANYRRIYSSLPGMGWSPDTIAQVLDGVRSDPGASRRLTGSYVLLSYPGAFTYGHVLVDISMRMQLAEAMGLYSGRKFLIQSPVHPWYLPFLAIAGISLNECVEVRQGDQFRVDDLYVPTMPGLNGVLNRSLASYAFGRMRAAVDNLFGPETERSGLLFPLHTTQSSIGHPRGVAQRHWIADTLASRFGIEAFDPLPLSFEQQVRKFRAARLVVGEDSSALHNVLWSNGADLAIMAPAGHFNFYHLGIQAIIGGRTAILWGEVIDREKGLFVADLDLLCRTIERLLHEPAGAVDAAAASADRCALDPAAPAGAGRHSIGGPP